MQLPDQDTLSHIIIQLAQQEILPRYQKRDMTLKQDGSIVTEADLAMHHGLQQKLYQVWPDIPFLSEEMQLSEQRDLLEKSAYCWCIDPLDGTTNFVAGIPCFSVSIALINQQDSLLGMVYDPIREELFYAEKAKGAYVNQQPLKVIPWNHEYKPAVALVDLKRLPLELKEDLVHRPPYSSQRNFGSCALEWCWMAKSYGQLYLHGGQKIWDYAAGSLIFQEAGGYCCTLEGEPIFTPQLEQRSTVGAIDEASFLLWKEYLSIS